MTGDPILKYFKLHPLIYQSEQQEQEHISSRKKRNADPMCYYISWSDADAAACKVVALSNKNGFEQ